MLLLINNSKKDHQPNNTHNIIAKKFSNIKNKKDKSMNKLIYNNSSSSIQLKKSKSKMYKYNKKYDYKKINHLIIQSQIIISKILKFLKILKVLYQRL